VNISENVPRFKHLETTMKNRTDINDKNLGNVCYYSVQKLFIFPYRNKCNIQIIILPVVLSIILRGKFLLGKN